MNDDPEALVRRIRELEQALADAERELRIQRIFADDFGDELKRRWDAEARAKFADL